MTYDEFKNAIEQRLGESNPDKTNLEAKMKLARTNNIIRHYAAKLDRLGFRAISLACDDICGLNTHDDAPVGKRRAASC